jgi:hypothetical protein
MTKALVADAKLECHATALRCELTRQQALAKEALQRISSIAAHRSAGTRALPAVIIID